MSSTLLTMSVFCTCERILWKIQWNYFTAEFGLAYRADTSVNHIANEQANDVAAKYLEVS